MISRQGDDKLPPTVDFLRDEERRFNILLTLNLILRFNLRLRGYSIYMECDFSSHHIQKMILCEDYCEDKKLIGA
jgi:hypothetical protein